MDRITLNLGETVSLEVFYELEDDVVLIKDVRQTEGTLFELLQQLDIEGDIISDLADRVNDDLLLQFNRVNEFTSNEDYEEN